MASSAPRLILATDGAPVVFTLEAAEAVLGRVAPATVVLDMPAVSREHAAIALDRGAWWLRDLASRNGTFLNGAPVGPEPVRLADGDEVVLGGVVSLRFSNPAETIQGPRIGRLAGVWLDEARRAAWVDGRLVEPPLSAAQLTLLSTLYARAPEVVTRDEVVAAVWPAADAAGVSEEAIDGLVKRLRQRLRETSAGTEYVEVVRGHGLRLVHPQ